LQASAAALQPWAGAPFALTRGTAVASTPSRFYLQASNSK
jgi:hypothetical protein